MSDHQIARLEFQSMTMRYSDDELRDRLQLGEDNAWEFKEVEFHGDQPTSRQRRTWADEIVAFANAQGGVLLLGVSDDGAISGMSRSQLNAVERAIGEVCRDSVTPEIHAQIHRKSLDGQTLILVELPEGYALHEHAGRSYVRVGSSKRPLSSDDRMRISQRRGQGRFRSFDEQPVANTGFSTLAERLWRPLLSAESISDPQVGLEKLGLLRTDSGVALSNRCRRLALYRGTGNSTCTSHHCRGAIPADRRGSGQNRCAGVGGPIDARIRDFSGVMHAVGASALVRRRLEKRSARI